MKTLNDLSINGILSQLSKPKENYVYTIRNVNVPNENKVKISKSDLMTLMFILLLSISIWVWAFYELVINFKNLPDSAKIIGILGLTLNNIAGGMFLTLFVVYIGKNEGSFKKIMIYK